VQGVNSKVNLTLNEGDSLRDIGKSFVDTLSSDADTATLALVIAFCKKYDIAATNIPTIENALKAKVKNPIPLLMMLGMTRSYYRHIVAVSMV
jgi:hypothetical protein